MQKGREFGGGGGACDEAIIEARSGKERQDRVLVCTVSAWSVGVDSVMVTDFTFFFLSDFFFKDQMSHPLQ